MELRDILELYSHPQSGVKEGEKHDQQLDLIAIAKLRFTQVWLN
jgi:hypothetical protein